MLPDAESLRATATTLADFTSPGLIVPHLLGGDAASVIQELSQALVLNKRVPDLLAFYQAALNQECLVGSRMQPGIAFAHARLSALRELSFALGRRDEPLRWAGKHPQAIRLVFLIAVPTTDSTDYFSLISGLARLGKQRHLVEQLYSAPGTFGIIEALKQIELQPRPGPDLIKQAEACSGTAMESPKRRLQSGQEDSPGAIKSLAK